MASSALITGITGQDGSYLAELLLDKGYEVHGLANDLSEARMERIAGIQDEIQLHAGDLRDKDSLVSALRSSRPDEVYNLAGTSFVGSSWDQPALTAEISAAGVARMLEAVRETCPDARFYQASSSEIFGKGDGTPRNEESPLLPQSPYGVAKAYSHLLTGNFRDSLGLYASSGILFNHESPRRGMEFVTRKITWHAAAIKLGVVDRLTLGDLDAERDWGYAKDYVEAMWLMLQHDEPGDFVIATGLSHSVQDCVVIAFDEAGVDDWEQRVSSTQELARPAEVEQLVGDATKAHECLGWSPGVDFSELIRLMVRSDLEALSS